MQTGQTQILPFFEGKRQFIIPIYQRPYSWTTEQCVQLWNDIVAVGTSQNMSGHFIGSIIYIQSGLYQASKMTPLLVIDGQQRLTTVTLLLLALAQHVKNLEQIAEINYQEVYDSYLINHHGKDEEHYKIILTQGDRETLKQLVENPKKVKPTKTTNRLIENYFFFKERLEKVDIDPQAIYTGISKLEIVEISLDKDRDNPQLIFESMNSTGVDLTQSDLIRNYIFMGLNEELQQRIYKAYWSQMEQNFNNLRKSMSQLEVRRLFRANIGTISDPFDHFLRDYLLIKEHKAISLNRVYQGFKNYRQRHSAIPIEEIVADIYDYADYYVKITLVNDEDEQIKKILLDIKEVAGSIAYPLILEIYNDYAKKRLPREDLIKILKFFESYFFRRIIVGIAYPSTYFFSKIMEQPIDKDHYYESIINPLLQTQSEFYRIPTDDEFKAAFVSKNIYDHPLRNYILRKLENYKRKEYVSIQNYTIEHIMPQNIKKSEAWKMELGENWKKIHPRYLHTIGNLTLTGYNSELSNRSFLEKRNMEGGFVDSPIRLNRSLAKLEHWNEEEIQKRAQTLAELALQIWSIPGLSTQKEKSKGSKDKAQALRDLSELKEIDILLLEQTSPEDA